MTVEDAGRVLNDAQCTGVRQCPQRMNLWQFLELESDSPDALTIITFAINIKVLNCLWLLKS